MKKTWYQKKDQPLSLSLLLVMTLLFVAVLAVCFSFLLAGEKIKEHRLFLKKIGSRQFSVEKDENAEKASLLSAKDIKVGEISGEIKELQGNKIVLVATVYGSEEQTFAITLNEEQQEKIFKYKQLETKDENGLAEIQNQKMELAQLSAGDAITLRFPLEVPVSEIGSGVLEIEEIIVDDEYDFSKEKEE